MFKRVRNFFTRKKGYTATPNTPREPIININSANFGMNNYEREMNSNYKSLPPPKPNLPFEKESNFKKVLSQDVQTAIFFDNDIHKIKQVQKSCGNLITGISVPESPGQFAVTLFEMGRILRGSSKALQYLNFLKTSTSETYEPYDSVSGIQQVHIDQANQWLGQTTGMRRAAIFDWDRTISMTEGILPFYDKTKFSYEDWLCYLCGGDSRMEMLRSFMHLLDKNSVEIIILTNNGSCGDPAYPDRADIFKNLVDTLLQGIPYTLICSKYTADGHKGVAIKADPRFRSCKVTRGGRRRRSKKQTKKRRS
jgi:hypothetical protein